jgi:hypothetical protein
MLSAKDKQELRTLVKQSVGDTLQPLAKQMGKELGSLEKSLKDVQEAVVKVNGESAATSSCLTLIEQELREVRDVIESARTLEPHGYSKKVVS